MTHDMGVVWLRDCFIPALKHPDKTNILICDGHGSHITLPFVQMCKENNIVLMLRVPHTSHRTQPEGMLYDPIVSRF